jgi:NitT/TauT family transport system ATP-binding protein
LRPWISLEEVSFSYGDKAGGVLSNVNVAINRGEFFVLLGPSGCGKTTVITLVAGYEHAVSGAVQVNGREVTGPGRDRIVIFQGDDSLLGWLNVAKNVAFGVKLQGLPRAEIRERVSEVLEIVGLAGQEHKFPHQLSGGMKQRVQIARALIARADVLLMDEPFGALDAQTRASLQDQLSRIWQELGQTVIFVTHDIAEAILLADRIGVMSRGPGATISTVVDNPLARPRARSSVEFAELYGQLESMITGGQSQAQSTASRTGVEETPGGY